MITGYIFDLDGTLLDTEQLWIKTVEIFIHRKLPDVSHEAVVKIVYGKSWNDIYRDIMKMIPDISMTLSEMQDAMEPIFLDLFHKSDVMIEGSINLLKDLSKNHPVCIVSGSSRRDIKRAVMHMHIEANIRFYIGSEDYTHGKPDPECFLMAAEKLKLKPAECLVFEDSAAGVKAAKRAGMLCVALKRKSALVQQVEGADLVLEDLTGFSLESFGF